jgi:hypothetical protein
MPVICFQADHDAEVEMAFITRRVIQTFFKVGLAAYICSVAFSSPSGAADPSSGGNQVAALAHAYLLGQDKSGTLLGFYRAAYDALRAVEDDPGKVEGMIQALESTGQKLQTVSSATDLRNILNTGVAREIRLGAYLAPFDRLHQWPLVREVDRALEVQASAENQSLLDLTLPPTISSIAVRKGIERINQRLRHLGTEPNLQTLRADPQL